MKELETTVYPSNRRTVFVEDDSIYGGAHKYSMNNCRGFHHGDSIYDEDMQTIQFVHKGDNGDITPGIQSEQLVIALLDRHEKLNARFPSEQDQKMIKGLELFLEACRERVQDRMNRGVMGDLKK